MRFRGSFLLSRAAWCVLAFGLLVTFYLFFWMVHLEQRSEQALYAAPSHDESKLVHGTAKAMSASAQPLLPGGGRSPVLSSFDALAAQPASFVASHVGALIVLFAGLLATFTATAYVKLAASRERRIQQVVAQRTEELKEDIKARQKVEQALVASEERARELADLSSDSTWEQDEHFRFTNFSLKGKEGRSVVSQLGFGMTRWQLPVDQDATNWSMHRAMLAGHQPFRNFEYKVLLDGGLVQWISTSGNPQFDADGNFKGYRGTSHDITDRKRTEEDLRRSRTKLRQLAAHRERIREDERKRIARDIHDELGQSLLVLRLDASRLAARPTAATNEQIAAAMNQIDTAIRGVRAIINDLRPAVLDLGLHAAVQWQAKQFEQRSDIPCEVHIDHEEFALSEQYATALFRSVQESLSNIIRHAHASHVWIDMHRKDGRLYLKIADDGIGIAPDSRRKQDAFGLIGIEERMHALGGTFSTASEPGHGMTIMLSIPIASEVGLPRDFPIQE